MRSFLDFCFTVFDTIQIDTFSISSTNTSTGLIAQICGILQTRKAAHIHHIKNTGETWDVITVCHAKEENKQNLISTTKLHR